MFSDILYERGISNFQAGFAEKDNARVHAAAPN